MNRLILIGNGFDKAHRLPTGYVDFINNYWGHIISQLEHYKSPEYYDELCTFKLLCHNLDNPDIRCWEDYMRYGTFSLTYKTPIDKINSLKEFTDDCEIKKTSFLGEIDKSVENKRWVDIEDEYYKALKKICHNNVVNKADKIQSLNEELDYIKRRLIQYLKSIPVAQVNERIKKIIYEPFRVKDISIAGQYKFKEELKCIWNKESNEIAAWIERYNLNRTIAKYEQTFEFDSLADYYNGILSRAEKMNIDAAELHFNMAAEHKDASWYNCNSLDYFLYPENIMLLTFNYTNSADLYKLKNASNVEVNHIHGELNDPASVIFGYGDDTDDEYNHIENLNDNVYLDNIKAFHYLGSANYRRMLEFIESAPYQIYIMGHSCGTSDRTLLNTLFEHDNCISIKPYFYQKSQTEDNYLELVQNISRNFKSRPKMRDRVVNKTFCEPLIKLEPEI